MFLYWFTCSDLAQVNIIETLKPLQHNKVLAQGEDLDWLKAQM